MSVASRPISTGKTRTCPHCKATILESLSICPGCMHHLRFDSEAAKRQVAAAPALRVEGIIRHPPLEEPLEYFVIIAVRNDRGEEVTRQVVNVGALQAAEKRTFTMSVEVLPLQAPIATKSGTTGTFKSPITQPAATVKPTTPPTGVAASPPTPAAGAPPANNPRAPTATSPPHPSGSANPSGTNPPGTNPLGTNPTGPASSGAAKPTSGYVLKPPSPGGPKRH